MLLIGKRRRRKVETRTSLHRARSHWQDSNGNGTTLCPTAAPRARPPHRQRLVAMMHGPSAAACPAPACPAHGNGSAARRLRCLASALHSCHGQGLPTDSPPRPNEVRSQPAAASRTPTTPWTAAPWGAGPDDRPCLAARALSQMLCDEPNAARCRSTVRRGCGAVRAWLAFAIAMAAAAPPTSLPLS